MVLPVNNVAVDEDPSPQRPETSSKGTGAFPPVVPDNNEAPGAGELPVGRRRLRLRNEVPVVAGVEVEPSLMPGSPLPTALDVGNGAAPVLAEMPEATAIEHDVPKKRGRLVRPKPRADAASSGSGGGGDEEGQQAPRAATEKPTKTFENNSEDAGEGSDDGSQRLSAKERARLKVAEFRAKMEQRALEKLKQKGDAAP